MDVFLGGGLQMATSVGFSLCSADMGVGVAVQIYATVNGCHMSHFSQGVPFELLSRLQLAPIPALTSPNLDPVPSRVQLG